jgi:small subunit ribosomal protein S2
MMKQFARSGKKILFVATKKQAKTIVSERAQAINMPFITERWPGGMLTNFATIRKSIKKMSGLERMATDGTFDIISKKERLQINRQKAKMHKLLGSIADLTRLPAAIFIVDTMKEHIAVAEAQKLNIPTFGLVDTNSDPNKVDFPIPGNDDATKAIALIVETVCKAIEEGLAERKIDREMEKEKEAAAEAEEANAEQSKTVVIDGEEPEEEGEAGKRRRKKKGPRKVGAA